MNTALVAVCTIALLPGNAWAFGLLEKADPAVEKGNDLYKAGKYDEALQAYEEAAKEKPESAAIQFDRGNALYKLGKREDAKDAYERALAGSPKDLRARDYYNLGNALSDMNQDDAAIKAYRHALQLDPMDPNARHNLELALLHKNRPKSDQHKNSPDGGPDKGDGGQPDAGDGGAGDGGMDGGADGGGSPDGGADGGGPSDGGGGQDGGGDGGAGDGGQQQKGDGGQGDGGQGDGGQPRDGGTGDGGHSDDNQGKGAEDGGPGDGGQPNPDEMAEHGGRDGGGEDERRKPISQQEAERLLDSMRRNEKFFPMKYKPRGPKRTRMSTRTGSPRRPPVLTEKSLLAEPASPRFAGSFANRRRFFGRARRLVPALLALCALLAASPAGAQDVEFYDTLNANEVQLGDVVILTVQISGNEEAVNAEFNIPQLFEFEVLTRHSSTSMRVSIANGQSNVVRSKVLTLSLQPKRTGTLHIHPIEATVGGRIYKTSELALKVDPADPSARRKTPPPQAQQQPDPFASFFGGQNPFQGATGDDDDDGAQDPFGGMFGEGGPPRDSDLFLRATVDKKQAYLGEQVTYSIYLFARVDVSRVDNPKLPKLDAFWAEDLESPTNITGDVRTVNGVPYRVYLLKRRALFPLKAGKQTIDPVEVDVITGLSLFGNGHTAHRSAQALELNVLPLPAGAPAGFATDRRRPVAIEPRGAGLEPGRCGAGRGGPAGDAST